MMGPRNEERSLEFITVYIALVITLFGICILLSPKSFVQSEQGEKITISPIEENEILYDSISYEKDRYILVSKTWQEYIREHPIPEEFLRNSSESSFEFDEGSNESSDEYDNVSGGDLLYSANDLFRFEATLYSECGAQGTSRQIQIANAWIARNKVEQSIANGSDDPFREALNPRHYQGVYDDPCDGWCAVSQEEGLITQELIDTNPAIHEISVGVLNGDIPSPIYDWDCCICCKTYDFDEVVAIAESLGLNNYFVIENGIFFPSSEWTEEVTQYLLNF